MSDKKFDTSIYDRYTVVNVNIDNLNSVEAPDFKSHLVMLKQEKDVNNLILDMENVEFVDSSGLSAFLTGNRLYAQEGSFILANIQSSSVNDLIMISRLDQVFVIIPTVQEAIDFVLMEELERELFNEEE